MTWLPPDLRRKLAREAIYKMLAAHKEKMEVKKDKPLTPLSGLGRLPEPTYDPDNFAAGCFYVEDFE